MLLLIYLPRKDERLRWPSWLTCSGQITHIVVTRQLQAEHRTGSVRRPKTDVLPTVLRNQPTKMISEWRSKMSQHKALQSPNRSVFSSPRLSHRRTFEGNLGPSDIGCQYSRLIYTARFIVWQPRRAADTSTNWRQSLLCCCTASMEPVSYTHLTLPTNREV